MGGSTPIGGREQRHLFVEVLEVPRPARPVVALVDAADAGEPGQRGAGVLDADASLLCYLTRPNVQDQPLASGDDRLHDRHVQIRPSGGGVREHRKRPRCHLELVVVCSHRPHPPLHSTVPNERDSETHARRHQSEMRPTFWAATLRPPKGR